ncbi:glycerophosphodiester phosphodiesterase [Spiractinospora alimapuensis]|nr:glycerophosphodiester phosphodiesterase [Spiractinospora alimapuensis]
MPRPDLIDVAHRGASAYAPENTLVAYEVADDLGTHMAEIDVQRTADGELVLMHDVTLIRTTNVEEVFPDRDSYNVGDFTLEEMRQLDAGSWFDESFAGEPIPTLGEALDLFEELDLPMLLEAKSTSLYPGIEEDIAEELWQRSYWNRPGRPFEPHRLVIQAFEWDTMERSKELLPRIPHGLLGRVDESEIEDYAQWADQINPNQNTIDADYVEAVQDAGLEIYVYTVNSESDINRAIDNGVNGIISDYPDRVLEIMAERDV